MGQGYVVSTAIASTQDSLHRDRDRFVRRVLVVYAIASPLMLLAGSVEWLFSPAGYIDPWHYVGYFLNYHEPAYSAGSYKLARLPWILSGWIVQQLVPAAAAPFILHLGYLLASTAGMYVLVRVLFGSWSVAALAATLLGLHTHFHGSGGWDYHNTAAGAFLLWALAAVTCAARVRTAAALAGAGCLIALAVHANITLVNLLPVFVAHLVVFSRHDELVTRTHLKELVRCSGWLLAGAIAITVVLMAINGLAGRDPLFFRPLIEIVIRYTSNPSAQAGWWQPWGPWVARSRHLSIPAAVGLMSSIALLVPRVRQRLTAAHILVLGEFIAIVVLWVVWQTAGQTALDWDYFAYPLFPLAYVALAALIHARWNSVPAAALVVLPVAAAALLILGAPERFQVAFFPGIYSAGEALPAVLLALAASATLWAPRKVSTTAFIVLFAAANSVAAYSTVPYRALNTCRTAAAFHGAVVAANKAVAESDPGFTRTTLWFKEKETLELAPGCEVNIGYLGYAIAGSGVPYVTDPFPMPAAEAIPAAAIQHVVQMRGDIVSLTADPAVEQSLVTRIEALDLAATPVLTRQLPFMGRTVRLSVFRVADARTEYLRTLPTAPVADWTDGLIKDVGTVLSYDTQHRASLEGHNSAMRFVPRVGSDHLALPFVPVPTIDGERGLEVDVAPNVDARDDCLVHIQDQNLHVLGSIQCGHRETPISEVIPITAEVTAVRVFFQDSRARTIVIPKRLTLKVHARSVAPPPARRVN